MNLKFDEFLKHGTYLKAWSQKTVRTYRQGLNAFEQSLGDDRSALDSSSSLTATRGEQPIGALNATITKTQLDAFVIHMRQRGLTAGGANMYIRTVNSYLSWLQEEGHLQERLRIKLLPDPKKPLKTFSPADIRLLAAYRPKGSFEARSWTLALCLTDTGIRIDEALGLERAKCDLDGLTITVHGKGNKDRVVPISTEFRKHLFRHLSKTEGRYVFAARSGRRLSYRNAYRDLKRVCKTAGVEGAHVHPHSFRHHFAVSFIRNGGDIYRLSRILGHTSISTTQLYLRSMGVEHLLEGHSRFSPLAMLA